MIPQVRSRGVAAMAALSVVAAAACKVESSDFKRPPALEPVVLDGPTPPPVASPTGEKLYQLLYAGEVGQEAAASGQQARLMAWLAVMEFSDEQLDALVALRSGLDEMRAEQAADRARLDALELATLGPIYDRITAAYAAGAGPDEDTLAALAEELEAARAVVYGERDPRALELERVQVLMASLEPWVGALSPSQQHDLGHSRFFLRRRLGPLLNPGDYGDLTGISWDGGDFRGVNTTFPDDDEHHMDIGGLWSTEFMRAPPELYLTRLQLKALTLMALEEPGLDEAIARRRAATAPPGTTPPAEPAGAPGP